MSLCFGSARRKIKGHRVYSLLSSGSSWRASVSSTDLNFTINLKLSQNKNKHKSKQQQQNKKPRTLGPEPREVLTFLTVDFLPAWWKLLPKDQCSPESCLTRATVPRWRWVPASNGLTFRPIPWSIYDLPKYLRNYEAPWVMLNATILGRVVTKLIHTGVDE